ncbi:hypothetical protein [Porphyromonas sp.]|uniref:hypothetical protein n=1 Tax=Porphyromonas sp. TaxID=1924944 RepID=UPI0026DBC9F4|nr:hypothetical protein [Porphyromonas sp.]MDO4771719.1 hypothetical protein [Porphyromonas sp.]
MNALKKIFLTLGVIILLVIIFLVAKGIIWISSILIKVVVIAILALIALGCFIGIWRSGNKK